jgi:hypothetical protein
MASTRIVLGSVFAASAVALVVACSSGTTTVIGGDGGTSGGLGSSGSSGTGTSGGSGSSVNKCGSSSGSNTCTEAENKAYSDCLTSACDSKYTECFGAGYKTGTFSGPCGTYLTCVNACACNDTACTSKCTAPSACTTCLQGIGSCSATCTAPACATGGSSGGTSGGTGAKKSCADLQACCAKITDATKKSQCDQTYNAVKSSEDSCNSIYSTFAADCP